MKVNKRTRAIKIPAHHCTGCNQNHTYVRFSYTVPSIHVKHIPKNANMQELFVNRAIFG